MEYNYPKVICSLCGKLKRANEYRNGNPICGNCYKKTHKEICSSCGREKSVHSRGDSGPICNNCYYREHPGVCFVCGKKREVHSCKTAEGKLLCENCALYSSPSKMFRKYKQAARKRNLTFNLSEQEFSSLVSGPCNYCGELLGQHNGIDRVDNSLGYEIENCVSCCATCNLMKRDMGRQQFLDRCRLVSTHEH